MENYPDFVILIGKKMKRIQLKIFLQVSTEWDTIGVIPEFPTTEGMVELYSSNDTET